MIADELHVTTTELVSYGCHSDIPQKVGALCICGQPEWGHPRCERCDVLIGLGHHMAENGVCTDCLHPPMPRYVTDLAIAVLKNAIERADWKWIDTPTARSWCDVAEVRYEVYQAMAKRKRGDGRT